MPKHSKNSANRRNSFFSKGILLFFCTAILIQACQSPEKQEPAAASDSMKPIHEKDSVMSDSHVNSEKIYENRRFRNVKVRKTGAHRYQITGEGQIFEAAFSWVVEDGHYELKKGFEMTDAGAPEWGKFSFSVEVEKQRPNSTLTLILFESSPQDGSRQYELPLFLE